MFVFFGYHTTNRHQEAPPSIMGHTISDERAFATKAESRVHVCRFVRDGLTASAGDAAAATSSGVGDANGTASSSKIESLFSRGYCDYSVCEYGSIFRAFCHYVSTEPAVRLKFTKAWLENLSEKGKGVFVFDFHKDMVHTIQEFTVEKFKFLSTAEVRREYPAHIFDEIAEEISTHHPKQRCLFAFIVVDHAVPISKMSVLLSFPMLSPGHGMVPRFHISLPRAMPQEDLELAQKMIGGEVPLCGMKNRLRKCMVPSCMVVEMPSETLGASSSKLKSCSRCKKAWYCSRKCQLQDWKLQHKHECV